MFLLVSLRRLSSLQGLSLLQHFQIFLVWNQACSARVQEECTHIQQQADTEVGFCTRWTVRHVLLLGKGGFSHAGWMHCIALHGGKTVLHGIGHILLPWLRMSSLKETTLSCAETALINVATSRFLSQHQHSVGHFVSNLNLHLELHTGGAFMLVCMPVCFPVAW